MKNEILDAVIDQLTNPDHHHGGFVTYLCERNYARAAFQADPDNLAALGKYIKWREWLVETVDGIENDTRVELGCIPV